MVSTHTHTHTHTLQLNLNFNIISTHLITDLTCYTARQAPPVDQTVRVNDAHKFSFYLLENTGNNKHQQGTVICEMTLFTVGLFVRSTQLLSVDTTLSCRKLRRVDNTFSKQFQTSFATFEPLLTTDGVLHSDGGEV